MSKITYDFIVEYAKTNRSQCHTSKEKIEKGEMRIGQMVQSPKFDGKIPLWHHWKWFFSKGNRGLTKWEMLHNRETLRPADQEKIKKLIEKHSGEEPKSNKRKASNSGDDEPEKKKKKDNDNNNNNNNNDDKKEKKEETEEEKAIRLETELLWEYRDQLSKLDLKQKEYKNILEHNKQSDKGGKDTLIGRIAEGMTFGALPEGCGQEECTGGHLYLDKSIGKYKCTGHSSSWSRCIWEGEKVEVKPWKFPSNIKEYSYFAKWKWVKRERAIKKSEIVRAEGHGEEGIISEEAKKAARAKRKFYEIGNTSDTPLAGYNIAFSGKFNKKLTELKDLVQELGGKTSTDVTPKVTHLIATQKSIDDSLTKVEDAIKFDVPILSIDWLTDTEAKKAILDQKVYLIGGSDLACNTLTRQFSDPAEDEKKEKEEQEKETKVKLVMKGRSAVDPAAGKSKVDNYHILDNGGTEIYNVTLNLTDVTTNINSYYGLQLLEHDKKKNTYVLFKKWGRVGTKIGGNKLEEFSSKEDAIVNFEKSYLDKTGNDWQDRDVFEKQPNKFYPVEIDYTEEKDDPMKKARLGDDKSSRLDARVKSLISLIFNINLMEESLLAMEIDLKKMPLGKLSKQHIQKGYKVLTEIDQTLKTGGPKMNSDLLRLTNQFYTLIPHDFGLKQIPLINSLEQLQIKLKLMEALIDIEIATGLMKIDGGEGESKVDANYKKLNTALTPIERNTAEFKLVETYMENQKGSFKLKLVDAFKVARNGEDDRFKECIPLGNRQLLWHGSRVTNYVGILSQGLRIAPPEAPKSGYRFGKGIYFADICEKSAHYCRGGSGSKDTILMMLVEVALGKMAELHNDQYMEEPLPGFNSTKALGAIAPVTHQLTEAGVIVPCGPIGNTRIRSSCTHNEFIVYTVKQACIRYLLKIELEG